MNSHRDLNKDLVNAINVVCEQYGIPPIDRRWREIRLRLVFDNLPLITVEKYMKINSPPEAKGTVQQLPRG